uniref:NAD(P)-dependent alcohol dehydrogenase n=1 Tax=Fulvivirga sp. TaxID=1931237 RepID=UPI00404A9580
MKAVTRTQYGNPEVLDVKVVQKPVAKPNEVLVRVHATTVNRTDCGILLGKPYLIRAFTGLLKPSSIVPGTDFAGQIEEVGSQVKNFVLGDKVWGLNDEGLASQSQYMTIRSDQAISKIPGGKTFTEVVACAEGAHYAYNFINKVNLRTGDKVLVYGATGAIGSAAVQLLKYFDVYVTAVGNTKNIEMMHSLGADKVVSYETSDFTKDENRYSFVFDAVGKSTFGACQTLLEPNGIYISSELGPNAENLYLPIVTKLRGGKRVIFPIPSNCKRSVNLMTQLLSEGKFKPVIDKTFQIEEIKDAYSYVMSGQKTGNVVVTYL